MSALVARRYPRSNNSDVHAVSLSMPNLSIPSNVADQGLSIDMHMLLAF
jgi:hypothetical protein